MLLYWFPGFWPENGALIAVSTDKVNKLFLTFFGHGRKRTVFRKIRLKRARTTDST